MYLYGRLELPLQQGRDLEQSSSILALLILGAGSLFVMGAATCIVGHSQQHPSSLHTRCQRHFTCPGSHDHPKCLQTLSNVPWGATSHTWLRIIDSDENVHEWISPLHYACASAFWIRRYCFFQVLFLKLLSEFLIRRRKWKECFQGPPVLSHLSFQSHLQAVFFSSFYWEITIVLMNWFRFVI